MLARASLLAGALLVAACGAGTSSTEATADAAAAEAPAVLTSLGGIAFAPYDRAARASGHLLLEADAAEGGEVAVHPFAGDVLAINGIRPGTLVLAAGAGTVESVQGTTVRVRSTVDPTVVVGYRHVVDVGVAPGQAVAAGDPLGSVETYFDGRFGRLHLRAERAGTAVCPVELLGEAERTRVTGELLQYFIQWNALVGREVHDHRTMSPAGCLL